MIPSDSQCISRCLAGDTQIFRVLVTRYQQPLRAFIRGRLPRSESPDEIAQETFVRAYTSLRKLAPPYAFFPWLVGIADFVLKESFRQHARHRLALTELAEKQSNQTPPDDTSDPELNRAVAALPEPYRQIVLLRYYAELSCQEIADRLTMPLGSVTKTLSRAYAMLREILIPPSPAPSPTFPIAAPRNHFLVAPAERMGRNHDL